MCEFEIGQAVMQHPDRIIGWGLEGEVGAVSRVITDELGNLVIMVKYRFDAFPYPFCKHELVHASFV